MAKTETTKEVVKKTAPPPPAVYQQRASAVHAEDIVVPKLLLAQGLSVSVAEGNAKMGDITNSLTGVVIGGATKEISFIPITIKKYWKRFEMVNGKKQYRGTEAFTKENANRALEDNLPSTANLMQMTKWSFDLTIDVLGFTEEDVQDPVSLPTAISFTRTSYKAGQQVNTLLASMEAVNLPYYTYLLNVSCDKKQNDKGIFYVFDVKPRMADGKMVKTPSEYYQKIERWSAILTDQAKNIVVDDSDEALATASAPVDDSRF